MGQVYQDTTDGKGTLGHIRKVVIRQDKYIKTQ